MASRNSLLTDLPLSRLSSAQRSANVVASILKVSVIYDISIVLVLEALRDPEVSAEKSSRHTCLEGRNVGLQFRIRQPLRKEGSLNHISDIRNGRRRVYKQSSQGPEPDRIVLFVVVMCPHGIASFNVRL